MCGKYFKRKHRIAKHMQKKHKHILVPGRTYQDSRHLLQNPKVPKYVMGFNNHAQRSTPPYYMDVDDPFNTVSKQNVTFFFNVACLNRMVSQPLVELQRIFQFI